MTSHSLKLSSSTAEAFFADSGCSIDFCFTEETESTNIVLKEEAEGCFDSTVRLLAADRQIAGKGTRGRSWVTPEDALLFTLSIPVPDGYDPGICPIKAGIAVVTSLREAGYSPSLKWPNDLMLNDAKFGGILCEVVKTPPVRMCCGASSTKRVLVGIGINLKISAESKTTNGWNVSGLCDDKVISIEERTELLCRICDSVVRYLSPDSLYRDVSDVWKLVDGFYGKEIFFESESFGIVRGIDAGIDPKGRILIMIEADKIKAYSSGSIMHPDNCENIKQL